MTNKKNEATAQLQSLVNNALDNHIGVKNRLACPRLTVNEIRSILPPICQLVSGVLLVRLSDNWRSMVVSQSKSKRGRKSSQVRVYA
ncbi:MAG: hypothetical protein WC942_08770 [Clostridia bacterium]|jgi:hypothetical protein